MTIDIIGIDCATQAKKTGIARGFFVNGNAKIEEATAASSHACIVDTIAEWISLSPSTLIAIDAPLGWPMKLGEELCNHEAGNPIRVERNHLFLYWSTAA